MIEKDTIEDLLIKLGENLQKPTTLCLIGSTVSIISGQPSRQTPDIDVWHSRSKYDVSDLKRACEAVGLLYDPKHEVDRDDIYLQIVRPGIVSLPAEFVYEVIGRYGNLTIAMPPPELIVAAKLVRASETDIEDALWWARGRSLEAETMLDAINSLPNSKNREQAKDNLIFVQLMLPERTSEIDDGPN